ncbi:MAG: type toxin-antitoxin system HipA family toxin [Ramlibacter sp.]|nr:type toxin-antitoxin system HipA family toxin [Ramlibacter sp.]
MAGRPSRSRALSIWSNGERVGSWRLPARGEMELQYDPGWLRSAAARPLSLSLPFGIGNAPLRGERVANYFDNLLPDSEEIRRRLATQLKATSAGPFDLLQAVGRDCVGSVQLLGEDETPQGLDRIEGTLLDEAQVADYLKRVTASPGLGAAELDPDDLRLSLAGAQEKTALLWHGGQWLRPHGATPTTHIMKLPLGLVGHSRVNLATSVDNEWLCLNLLRELGLPVPDCAVLVFAGQRVLAVERFDRTLHSSGRWWLRLPQEDFCQALGAPPNRKYEADGGPGVRQLAGILRQSENAVADIETLLAAQIAFWMLAAPDGHAKNFSLRLLAGGRYRLTPLYDVVSIWPVEGSGPNQWSWHKAKMAMAVAGKNRHYLFKDIERRHFDAMAAQCGYGRDAASIVTRLLQRTEPAISAVAGRLPAGCPAQVADAIFRGLRRSAQRLEAMAA